MRCDYEVTACLLSTVEFALDWEVFRLLLLAGIHQSCHRTRILGCSRGLSPCFIEDGGLDDEGQYHRGRPRSRS
jgi:hypothetical protein